MSVSWFSVSGNQMCQCCAGALLSGWAKLEAKLCWALSITQLKVMFGTKTDDMLAALLVAGKVWNVNDHLHQCSRMLQYMWDFISSCYKKEANEFTVPDSTSKYLIESRSSFAHFIWFMLVLSSTKQSFSLLYLSWSTGPVDSSDSCQESMMSWIAKKRVPVPILNAGDHHLFFQSHCNCIIFSQVLEIQTFSHCHCAYCASSLRAWATVDSVRPRTIWGFDPGIRADGAMPAACDSSNQIESTYEAQNIAKQRIAEDFTHLRCSSSLPLKLETWDQTLTGDGSLPGEVLFARDWSWKWISVVLRW